MRKYSLVLLLSFLFVGISPVSAFDNDFSEWLENLRYEAFAAGISHNTISKALNDDLAPIEVIVKLDRKQPEKSVNFENYKKRIVTVRFDYLDNKDGYYKTYQYQNKKWVAIPTTDEYKF